jgi:hypothetical protein
MHAILPAKNVHAPVHTCPCNAADFFLPWKLLRTYLESCTSIVHCCLPPALLLSRLNQSLDAVCSKKASKSTLAHYAVAAAVSHKHHSIICVCAGLIQFVYGSHSRLAAHLIYTRQNGENVNPFGAIASVVGDQSRPWTGWIDPAPV